MERNHLEEMNYLEHFMLLISFPNHTQGSSWSVNASKASLLTNLSLTQAGLGMAGMRLEEPQLQPKRKLMNVVHSLLAAIHLLS